LRIVPVYPLNEILFRVRRRVTMPRKLVWTESQEFHGYGCSQCVWVFHPSGALVGASLDKMKRDYLAQRDKEFTEHVCKIENPKRQRVK
jgi:hypothetical protein